MLSLHVFGFGLRSEDTFENHNGDGEHDELWLHESQAQDQRYSDHNTFDDAQTFFVIALFLLEGFSHNENKDTDNSKQDKQKHDSFLFEI
jgi:hypothetical protein